MLDPCSLPRSPTSARRTACTRARRRVRPRAGTDAAQTAASVAALTGRVASADLPPRRRDDEPRAQEALARRLPRPRVRRHRVQRMAVVDELAAVVPAQGRRQLRRATRPARRAARAGDAERRPHPRAASRSRCSGRAGRRGTGRACGRGGRPGCGRAGCARPARPAPAPRRAVPARRGRTASGRARTTARRPPLRLRPGTSSRRSRARPRGLRRRSEPAQPTGAPGGRGQRRARRRWARSAVLDARARRRLLLGHERAAQRRAPSSSPGSERFRSLRSSASS